MRHKNIYLLIILSLIFGVHSSAQVITENKPRDLYVYSFGGIEDMVVDDAVDLLDRLGYAGIAAEARGETALIRLSEYQEWSKRKGDDFEVVSAFMAHRFNEYGFTNSAHTKAIDLIAGKEGYLWLWVRDVLQDGSITDANVEIFIRGILEYAVSKNVKVVLYPHYNTWFPTTDDALKLVEKIDNPSLGIAINLCHEIMSDKGDVAALEQTFENAKDRLFTVVISGSLIELDRTSVRTMNESTIKSLDNSPYDLKPFIQLIKKSGFDGPIGFINYKLPNPEDYLKRTMNRWTELCKEVGLYENYLYEN